VNMDKQLLTTSMSFSGNVYLALMSLLDDSTLQPKTCDSRACVILYIKAIVSVCPSVRVVLGNFFQSLPVPCGVLYRRGGGSGKLRNFLIWEFRSL